MFRFFKSKRKRRTTIIVMIVFAFLVSGLFVVVSFNEIKTMISKTGEQQVDSSTKSGYSQRNNATDYQKELFKELESIYKNDDVNQEELVKCIAKNFIADFYTWSNKKASYDVGGMQFVNSNITYNFYYKARDMYYTYVSEYLSEYSSDEIPEIASVDITDISFKESYDFYDSTYMKYYVGCSWTYKNESNITKGLLKNNHLIIIYKDNKAEVVEVYE